MKFKRSLRIPKYLLLTIAVTVIGGLFFYRYGVNAVKYKSVDPRCDQIHTVEQCRSSGIYSRAERQAENRDNNPGRLRPIAFSIEWTKLMRSRSFVVAGHRMYKEPHYIFNLSWILIALFSVSFIRMVRPKNERNMVYLAIIAATFTLFMLILNFKGYLIHGNLGQGIQGRYLFPVSGILFFIGVYYTFKLFNKKLYQAVVALCMLIILPTIALPAYIASTDDTWHSEAGRKINPPLKKYLNKVIHY